jgi:hypothetical protein
MSPLAEAAAVTWPLAMTLASVAVADRVRARRRRRSLNEALHELRRPLQALVLAPPTPGSRPEGRLSDHLGLALEALAELDREVNGGVAPAPRRLQDARALAIDTVERWRGPAAVSGRRIELVWRAGRATVSCEPSRLARALDNLIANALEHGRSTVRLEGTRRRDRLRLVVADGADAGIIASDPAMSARPPVSRSPWVPPGPGRAARLPVSRPWSAPRAWSHRGHGLRIVARVAAEHGGRFAICRHERGASAVLELPLAEDTAK